LYPPSQARRVYRVPKITHCRFDPNVADYDAFPRARRARAWECTLTPGESLYIPAGWYHQVTVVSGWAINVNVFWPRPAGQALLLPGLWRFLLRRERAKARRSLASIAPRRRRSAPPDAVATGGGRRRWRTG
jgi:ribosomal protein L16 Arg81 hydroxylase